MKMRRGRWTTSKSFRALAWSVEHHHHVRKRIADVQSEPEGARRTWHQLRRSHGIAAEQGNIASWLCRTNPSVRYERWRRRRTQFATPALITTLWRAFTRSRNARILKGRSQGLIDFRQ